MQPDSSLPTPGWSRAATHTAVACSEPPWGWFVLCGPFSSRDAPTTGTWFCSTSGLAAAAAGLKHLPGAHPELNSLLG